MTNITNDPSLGGHSQRRARAMLNETGDEMVPISHLPHEFTRSLRTIRRWARQGKFGPTVVINHRAYARRSRIEGLKPAG
jgi:hypothetical protein